jgi:hypothetical protein
MVYYPRHAAALIMRARRLAASARLLLSAANNAVLTSRDKGRVSSHLCGKDTLQGVSFVFDSLSPNLKNLPARFPQFARCHTVQYNKHTTSTKPNLHSEVRV